MNVALTLNFTSLAEAHRALIVLETWMPTVAERFAAEVSPDGGSPDEPALDPNTVFGIVPEVAVAPAAPTPAAPSTADAAASPTAPAAPPAPTAAATDVPAPPAPSPAATATAPTAPAAPTPPAATGGVTLDKAGLPWDHRIHSSTKAVIGDGTWRQKRNLDPALKTAVEAELRQALAAGVTPGTAPTPPAPPAPPPAAGAATFSSLMQLLSPLIDAGKLSNLEQATTLGKHMLSNLFQLATVEKTNPAAFAAVAADFTALAATKQ